MDNFVKKNKYNVSIAICCASCLHNSGALTEFTRVCDAGKGAVRPSFSCIKWAMKPSLDKAGKGGGLIKKRAYLEFVRDYKHTGVHHTPLEEIQMEFEKEHGSIYMDDI